MKSIFLPLNFSASPFFYLRASAFICGSRSLSSCFLNLKRVLFASVYVALTSYAAPRVHCDAPKYDFGTVIGQDKITHEFMLMNNGDEPLVISKIKNCCGVASTITPMEILPGSNAICKAIFTTRNRYGKQNKQILIASNDRKNPYFELKMVGTLLRPVEFSPRLIRLGTLLPDADCCQTITATNLLERTVTLQLVESTIKGIRAEVIESTDRNWSIELKFIPPLMPGKINGQIQLHFSSGTVSVPIIGVVKPIIQVVPEQIQFSSRATNASQRLVMLRSSDGRPFDIFSIQLGTGKGSFESEKLSDDCWQLKLSVVPDSLFSTSSVQIKTSCKSQPTITIPLSAR